jgi:hypothetical protein
MSARRVRVVLICEDSQHEAFTRRFLAEMGWNTRELRVEKSPSASGSAEQWVRMKFPDELKIYRRRKQKAASALIAVIDADKHTVPERIQELEDQCKARQIPFRENDEAVAIAVPKRNIETWIRYLDGQPYNEEVSYPKLYRARECKQAVSNLVRRCREGGVNDGVPPSLILACEEYDNRIRTLQ